MKSHARVVIIGGGMMGVGLLYHLAEEGWEECVLVEKGDLTSGSTWHAAGQCPSFIADYNMAKIHHHSNTLYPKLDPMIDGTERTKQILAEAEEPSVAILLLDFIFGYIAANDPVGELVEALQQAKADRSQAGGELTIVASVCGTKEDPRDLDLQVEMLQACGVHVFHSNARAAAFCQRLLVQR